MQCKKEVSSEVSGTCLQVCFLASLFMTIAVVFEREGTVTVAASKVLDTEMDGPQVSPEVAFPATSELF